jgi:hypothetical protein
VKNFTDQWIIKRSGSGYKTSLGRMALAALFLHHAGQRIG